MQETPELDEKHKDRAIVFIDGSNLYHRLKEKGWKTWINMGTLATRIAGQRILIHTYYYNAPPPGGHSFSNKANEFLAEVKSNPIVTVRLSRLQATVKTDENGSYRTYVEKGADTALSTDMIALASEDKFDVGIIVSNDSDFEPAARTVIEVYKKRVEVIYFEGSRPFAMANCGALMREFRKSMVTEYDYGHIEKAQPLKN